MNTILSRRRSLLLLALACLIPLPFCIGAFLVNIELAIRVFAPSFHVLDQRLPAPLYHLWTILSADLSCVSTLIPVMILAFPLAQLIRILRRMDSDPTFAQRLGPDPYPSHFGFFQVMLGLTGTLYGMYIGLDVSGVSELAGQTPTSETIRQSLDRLLGGTATALLSSLVGLIGAFLTARPIPWIFGRTTGVKADETRQTLTSTIERLTDDLRGLSQASRTFADYLNPENAATLMKRLEQQEAASREVCAKLDLLSRLLETLVQNQSIHARQLSVLENLAAIAATTRDQSALTNAALTTIIQNQGVTAERLSKLDSLDQTLRQTVPLLEASGSQLAQLTQTQQQTQGLLQRLVDHQDVRQQDVLRALTGLAATATAQREQVQREQEALRSALAAYLNPSREKISP